MDIALKYYSNKISHLTKCTNTQPKKIAKMRIIPVKSMVILLKNAINSLPVKPSGQPQNRAGYLHFPILLHNAQFHFCQ